MNVNVDRLMHIYNPGAAPAFELSVEDTEPR